MPHAEDVSRRRATSDWTVQTLEGRILLSRAGAPLAPVPAAQVEPLPGQRVTLTSLQAATESNSSRPTVGLVATVRTAGSEHLVSSGEVRFLVVSPTFEGLGVAHLNRLGQARLHTHKLSGGGTFQIEAQFIPAARVFATSSARITVEVAPPLVTSFLITAPRYFGAPGTPVTFSVTALDRNGQPVPSYTGTIDLFSPTDHAAKLLQRSYTFTTADQGTHEFPDGITFHKGGAELLKVDQVSNTRIVGEQRFGIE